MDLLVPAALILMARLECARVSNCTSQGASVVSASIYAIDFILICQKKEAIFIVGFILIFLHRTSQ